MSVRAMEWVSGVKVGGSAAKNVLVALCNFHHDKNDLCDPSIKTLLQFTELSKTTLNKWLDFLNEAGFITIVDRPGGTKKYIINFDVTSPKIGRAIKSGNGGNLVKGSPKIRTPEPLLKLDATPPKIGKGDEDITPPKILPDLSQNLSQPLPNLGDEQDNGIEQDIPPLVVPPGESETVIVMPTNRYNTRGEVFRVTTDMANEWGEAFPLVNIGVELRRARVWLQDNPDKRKTLRGMRRFLGSWMSRQQDRGGTPAMAPVSPSTRSRDRSLQDDLDDTSWAYGGTS